LNQTDIILGLVKGSTIKLLFIVFGIQLLGWSLSLDIITILLLEFLGVIFWFITTKKLLKTIFGKT